MAISPVGSGSNSLTGSKNAMDIQDRFLKLLVTQMRNQDPLNPLDNAQVTTQLAQITTVNGIQDLNATMKSLFSKYQSAETLSGIGLIGKSILTAGSRLDLANGTASGAFDLHGPADHVTVKIYDENNNLVHTELMEGKPIGINSFNWDGAVDNSNTPAVSGKYRFEVTATQNGTEVKVDSLSRGRVDSVLLTDQGFVLNSGTLGSVNMYEVRQVFAS